MKEFITSDRFLLEEGNEYLWSGFSEKLYTTYRWIDRPVKVRKIIENVEEYNYVTNQKNIVTKVELYDYDENKIFTVGDKYLKENSITFKRRNAI